jgi:hypothetical protein
MFFGCTYWGRLNINSHGHRSRCSPEFSLVKNLCEPMWTWGSCNVATLFTNLFCSTLSKSAKGMALSWRQPIIPRPRETPRPPQSLIFAHLFIDFYELCSLQNVSVRSTLLLINLINNSYPVNLRRLSWTLNPA